MCIAILKPVGKSLSRELLYNCYTSNPDGCGFAYATGDDVIIHKFMKFEDFYNEYQKYDGKYTMLIHFRIATHGAVELENCHPFVLNSRMALIHNGIIAGYGDKKTKSDTRDFIDKVLFVVDRKDLDYQTMKEYDRFKEGAANSNTSTKVLEEQLNDPNAKIIITTIQKLSQFIKKNADSEVFNKHVVFIFDECHRSQFGEMHKSIIKKFNKYYIFVLVHFHNIVFQYHLIQYQCQFRQIHIHQHQLNQTGQK